jgi:hypothetical protein
MGLLYLFINKLVEKRHKSQQVQSDRTTPNNKPDIIIRDHDKGTSMLTDVAISGN